jgi:hypothetical protein
VWPVSDELIAHGHAGAAETILEKEVLREADIVPGGVPVRDRAHLLHRLGRHSEALALWRQVAKEHPDSLEAIGSLGITAARVGNTAVALEMDGRLETWPDTLKRGRHTFWRAKIATALGDKERAVELLHRVPTLKWAVYLEAHRDFDLRPLRGYPPFEAFAKPKR